eukprot:scaffold317859_cov19-Prasinocladus_malaysianus.AAC.1
MNGLIAVRQLIIEFPIRSLSSSPPLHLALHRFCRSESMIPASLAALKAGRSLALVNDLDALTDAAEAEGGDRQGLPMVPMATLAAAMSHKDDSV